MPPPKPKHKTHSAPHGAPRARSRPKRTKSKGNDQIAVIPRDTLEPAIDEIRHKHPHVTDFQAEVVRLFLHKGWSPATIAKYLKCEQQRIRYHMEKEHVAAYRQELAMRAMGWDAVLAQQTLVSLLTAKSRYIRLEAARDIASRAGLSLDRAAAPAVAVQLNFGVQMPTVGSPLDALSQALPMGPLLAQPEPSGGGVQEEGAQPLPLPRSASRGRSTPRV